MNEIAQTLKSIEFIKHVTHKKENKTENIDNKNKFNNVSDKPLEIMVFTGYTQTDLFEGITKNTGSVKELTSNTNYNDVSIIGSGFGNYKGIYMPIGVGELVVVGWLSTELPVILGSVNDYFTDSQDNIPVLRPNELLISPKRDGGSVMFFALDDSIKLKSFEKSEILINEDVLIKRQDDTQIYLGDLIAVFHKSTNRIIITDTDINLINGSGIATVDSAGIRSTNYKSADGTSGITANVGVLDSMGFPITLQFKNGLLVGVV